MKLSLPSKFYSSSFVEEQKTNHNVYVQQGFTLLEVMVALAILAVVAISASQASRSYTLSVNNMKTRTQAYFVAQNALADLRINSTWLTNEQIKQVDENGQQWQVTLTPQNTDIDNLKKVNIAVAPITDGKVLHSVVSFEAMLSKPLSNSGGGQ